MLLPVLHLMISPSMESVPWSRVHAVCLAQFLVPSGLLMSVLATVRWQQQQGGCMVGSPLWKSMSTEDTASGSVTFGYSSVYRQKYSLIINYHNIFLKVLPSNFL